MSNDPVRAAAQLLIVAPGLLTMCEAFVEIYDRDDKGDRDSIATDGYRKMIRDKTCELIAKARGDYSE